MLAARKQSRAHQWMLHPWLDQEMTHGSAGCQGQKSLKSHLILSLHTEQTFWLVFCLSPTPMPCPHIGLHCQFHQRLPSDQSTSRCACPRLSVVSLTLKTAVAQPTTVPLNPVMPTPEPHCCKWGPGVSRQWGVRDLPGVPLCLDSFFCLRL